MNYAGNFESIYCHWDGYPSGVGKMLKENYSEKQKINALMKLGDISSLDKKLYPTSSHSFENPEPDVTVAYGRDRGDDQVSSVMHSSLEELKEYSDMVYYVYIWQDNQWYYRLLIGI